MAGLSLIQDLTIAYVATEINSGILAPYVLSRRTAHVGRDFNESVARGGFVYPFIAPAKYPAFSQRCRK